MIAHGASRGNSFGGRLAHHSPGQLVSHARKTRLRVVQTVQVERFCSIGVYRDGHDRRQFAAPPQPDRHNLTAKKTMRPARTPAPPPPTYCAFVTVTAPSFFSASPIFDASPTTTTALCPGAMYFFAAACTWSGSTDRTRMV